MGYRIGIVQGKHGYQDAQEDLQFGKDNDGSSLPQDFSVMKDSIKNLLKDTPTWSFTAGARQSRKLCLGTSGRTKGSRLMQPCPVATGAVRWCEKFLSVRAAFVFLQGQKGGGERC